MNLPTITKFQINMSVFLTSLMYLHFLQKMKVLSIYNFVKNVIVFSEHMKSCEMPEWDYKEFEVAFEEYKRNSVNLKHLYRTTLKVC